MSLFGSFWKKDSENTRKVSSSGRWQVGDKIANQYDIQQILGGEGKSGMGIVYVCKYRESELMFALKTLQGKYLSSNQMRDLFTREALIWLNFGKHPNIVNVRGVERMYLEPCIILEYIYPDTQGRNTLTQYLSSLTLPEILKFSIQFCYGMEYAYSKGIDAHRDIKPDNIMITADKTVKITDFGLAKALQGIQLKEDLISTEDNPSLSVFQSKGKHICGTLPYMAPEQFDGYADKRSDIYSFGVVLYQMVTNGKVPFVGETKQEYEKLHKYGEITVISSSISPIIQKCLEKDRNKRYQDFSIIRQELQSLLLKETGEILTPPKKNELEAWEWFNKGVALYNLFKREEAISCHEKAIEIDPGFARAWHSKGFISHELGRYEDAIICYDKALEIDPKNAKAWCDKALFLSRVGKHREALQCADKGIKIDPTLFHIKKLIEQLSR